VDSGGVSEAKGDRVFVRLRGRGEYVIRLDPRGDSLFLLAGHAKGNKIEFRIGGDEFRIVCTAPIAAQIAMSTCT
jgi:hypothetical protein